MICNSRSRNMCAVSTQKRFTSVQNVTRLSAVLTSCDSICCDTQTAKTSCAPRVASSSRWDDFWLDCSCYRWREHHSLPSFKQTSSCSPRWKKLACVNRLDLAAGCMHCFVSCVSYDINFWWTRGKIHPSMLCSNRVSHLSDLISNNLIAKEVSSAR